MSGDRPEVVVLVGLQASGKSTFFRQRFAGTHVHISKDLMHNGSRKEARRHALLTATLARGSSLVVDNTNASAGERQRIIAVAKDFDAQVTGYWSRRTFPVLLARNATREGRARVPDVAVFATLARLDEPGLDEGFDRLFVVHAVPGEGFVCQAFE
jgi:predicted kinase